MKSFVARLALLSLVASPIALADHCTGPDAPTLPDGATASMDDMLAGQKAVKAFQADAIAYRGCLEGHMDKLKEAASEGDDSAGGKYEAMTEQYNASVSAEDTLAADFNTAIRSYKAANPN